MKPTQEERIAAFDRLINELLGPAEPRSKFQPWEIEVLLDIDSCNLPASSKREPLLLKYHQAARRRMQSGTRTPLKLSQYLDSLKDQFQGRKPVERETGTKVRVPAR
jgi:hypothetical protein